MTPAIQPRYEFRIFGNNLSEYEDKIKQFSEIEMTREMDSIYILTPYKKKSNIKIRQGVMDIKHLEKEHECLQQWNPFLVGSFPLAADVIKSIVFPALGIVCPVFERKKYTLKQFVEEVISIDPDITVAYVWKTRHAFTIDGCITEIAEIKVNGASIKTICIEAEDPKKVIAAKELIGINNKIENVNYPLAMKRIMGLVELPENWNNINF